MGTYYLAVDIGASSGRHILGHLENGQMVLEEIYRFENGMDKQGGKLLWDTGRLLTEIVNGMKMCRQLNKIPASMSVDTWAVDYVLLDEQDQVLGDTYGYRDRRTAGMDEEVYKLISQDINSRGIAVPENLYDVPLRTLFPAAIIRQPDNDLVPVDSSQRGAFGNINIRLELAVIR